MGHGVIDNEKEAKFTADYIREKLRYDPNTGIFTWRVKPSKRMHIGARAGYALGGKYCLISIDGKHIYAHRLAWLIMTGKWPTAQIDHRDRNGLNNEWSNLREATRQQNTVNSGAYRTNIVGLKGVSRVRKTGRFVASINIGGQLRSLGTYATAEEAHEAYVKAALELHGEFARLK